MEPGVACAGPHVARVPVSSASAGRPRTSFRGVETRTPARAAAYAAARCCVFCVGVNVPLRRGAHMHGNIPPRDGAYACPSPEELILGGIFRETPPERIPYPFRRRGSGGATTTGMIHGDGHGRTHASVHARDEFRAVFVNDTVHAFDRDCSLE